MDSATKRSRMRLQNPYAFLDGDGRFDNVHLKANYPTKQSPGKLGRDAEIEQIVVNLQKALWTKAVANARGKIIDPLEILDPVVASEHLGIRVEIEDVLGDMQENGVAHKTVGSFDRRSSLIRLAKETNYGALRFTAAHELGHAQLHLGMTMHRDRAIDQGSSAAASRDEIEANLFAALFLMPRKRLTEEFKARFGQSLPLRPTVDVLYGLGVSGKFDVTELEADPDKFAKLLASSVRYYEKPFGALSHRFGVSLTAMARQIVRFKLAC